MSLREGVVISLSTNRWSIVCSAKWCRCRLPKVARLSIVFHPNPGRLIIRHRSIRRGPTLRVAGYINY
jgi:hypothetical protein